MSLTEYQRARKLGQRAYHQSILEGSYPYLRVLDELLTYTDTKGERDLGLIEIPIEQIAGTKTAGRTQAFASNFMPLLGDQTEFASKWSALYDAQMEEGIREPVIACEFMNSYYIIEGNKRVSVLKYSGAVTVSGYVTRIIPVLQDNNESKIYQEFMEFSQSSGIYTIYFSKPGSFPKLCRLVGKEMDDSWTEDERRDFSFCLQRFTDAFLAKGGKKLPITPGDAFLLYLDIYGYQGMTERSQDELRQAVSSLWKDFKTLPGDVSLIMQPEKTPEKSVFQKLIAPAHQPLTVGFLYHKTAETSSWTYGHDLGRLYVENNLGASLNVRVYDGIDNDEDCLARIEEAAADGCTVLFTTSPRFLGSSLKISIKYPQLKLLNCSVNAYSGHVRTYYGRLYEAKFLVGMLAGIMTRSDAIGYIADYPIFGTTASINAFALGVRMVNPTARVHLAWSSQKGVDPAKELLAAGVSHISGHELITPEHRSRFYGLYDVEDRARGNLASSIWHWGKFYQRVLQTILNGGWDRTAPERMAGSMNYWWGISSGMIDIICSGSIPEPTLHLMELVKKQIVNGSFQIFSGNLYSQNHVLQNKNGEALSPVEIIQMDWLAENVEGRIPTIDELEEDAVPMVAIQGISSSKKGL